MAPMDHYTETQTSRLLNLPGELRNRIYEYALAKSTFAEQGSCYPNVLIRGLVCAASTHKGNVDLGCICERSKCVHLLHVCRQIRAEIRPLYFRNPVSIHYTYAQRFVFAFFPVESHFRADTEKLDGRFQLFVEDLTTRNIAPLLQRFYQLTKLAFEFATRQSALRNVCSDCNFLFIQRAEVWKKRLESDIREVSFWPDKESSKFLEVYFRPQTPEIMAERRAYGPLHDMVASLGLNNTRHVKLVIRLVLEA